MPRRHRRERSGRHHVDVDIGRARIAREGSDVTIVTYGAAVHHVMAAAQGLEKERISVEVLDLRSLQPWDEAAVLAAFCARGLGAIVSRVGSLNATHRLSVRQGGNEVLDEDIFELRAVWSDVTRRIAALRDNPACAEQEHRLRALLQHARDGGKAAEHAQAAMLNASDREYADAVAADGPAAAFVANL